MTPTETLKALDEIEKDYFGKDTYDYKVNVVRENLLGTLHEERVSAYDEEKVFEPYSNQEEAVKIHNAIEVLKEYFFQKKKKQCIAEAEALKNKDFRANLVLGKDYGPNEL